MPAARQSVPVFHQHQFVPLQLQCSWSMNTGPVGRSKSQYHRTEPPWRPRPTLLWLVSGDCCRVSIPPPSYPFGSACQDCLTVGVVTKPFAFEGRKRMSQVIGWCIHFMRVLGLFDVDLAGVMLSSRVGSGRMSLGMFLVELALQWYFDRLVGSDLVLWVRLGRPSDGDDVLSKVMSVWWISVWGITKQRCLCSRAHQCCRPLL